MDDRGAEGEIGDEEEPAAKQVSPALPEEERTRGRGADVGQHGEELFLLLAVVGNGAHARQDKELREHGERDDIAPVRARVKGWGEGGGVGIGPGGKGAGITESGRGWARARGEVSVK